MITIVTGLARAGLSVVMQMAAAGGYPVTGNFPGYHIVRGPVAWGDLVAFDRSAVKIIDPVRHARLDWTDSVLKAQVVIVRRTDKSEQARSAIALTARNMPGFAPNDGSPENVEKVAASFRADDDRLEHVVNKLAVRKLFVTFEDMLYNPRHEAARLAEFLELPETAVPLMAAQVRYRPFMCQNLAIDNHLERFGRLRTPEEAMADP